MDFARERFEEAGSAKAYGPGRRPFAEQAALKERFGEIVGAVDVAMLALLEAPAPDLEALAVKISLIGDHCVWELEGGEDCLVWLEADAQRLAGGRTDRELASRCHGGLEQDQQRLLAYCATEHVDDRLRQSIVRDDHLPAIQVKEYIRRGERRSLVALKEGVVAGDTNEQGKAQRHHVTLAIMPVVDRLGRGAFEKAQVAQAMGLASPCDQIAVDRDQMLRA